MKKNWIRKSLNKNLIKNLGLKKCWSQKFVCPKTFCVQTNFALKKNFVFKKFLCSKKFCVQNIFGPTKFGVQKNLGSKKVKVKRFQGPKKF